MKLLFLYGPPAVGKYTVAKELTALTGFKLLHNHLTIDLVASIFEPGSDPYFNLVRNIRFSVLEAAAQSHIPGIIMTFVYSPSRWESVRQYIDLMKSVNGETCFVHLHCDKSILAERVVSENRKKYGKLVSVEKLSAKLNELGDPLAEIEGEESLSIDAGILLPRDAAQEIVKHYSLPRAAL